MTTDYSYSLASMAQILSALEGERRNPNTKRNAIKAIERAASRLGLDSDDVFDAADGLLSGRLDAAAWLAQLRDEGCGPTSVVAEPPAEQAAAPAPGDEPAEASVMPNAGSLAVTPRRRGGSRPDSKQARMIAMLKRPEGRHRRADRRSDGVAAPYRSRRHQRCAEEEARPDHHLGEGAWRASHLPHCRVTAA